MTYPNQQKKPSLEHRKKNISNKNGSNIYQKLYVSFVLERARYRHSTERKGKKKKRHEIEEKKS